MDQVKAEEVGSRVGHGIGDSLFAAARRPQHLGAAGLVQIDHRLPRLVEDAQLGAEIILQIGMLLGADVVLAYVEEGGRVQLHSGHPAVGQGLAGHLQHQIAAARLRRVPQMPLQVRGFGRGQRGGDAFHAVVGDDAGKQARVVQALGFPPAVQDGFEEKAGGGLALGAGDAGDHEPPRRMAEVSVRQQAQGEADVAHLQAGHGPAEVAFADVGRGAVLNGLIQIFLLEGVALADEKVALPDGAGIVAKAGERPVRGLGQVSRVRGQQTGAGKQIIVFAETDGRRGHGVPPCCLLWRAGARRPPPLTIRIFLRQYTIKCAK